MPGDGTHQPLLLTADGHRSHPNGSLDLGHRDATLGQSTQPAGEDTSSKYDDEKTMRLAEWVYLNVEEVWSAFNLLAEATARGYQATPVNEDDAETVQAWNRAVAIEDKVRMWIKNALVYGRAVMEAGEDFLKVRNPRSIELEQDEDGELVEATQVLDDGEHPIPVDRVHVFTLHRLFSDDVRGISAVQPVLQTVDDMVGASRVNRAIQERYRAPIRIIEMPEDATDQDRKSVQSQLEETPPDMDLVLPPGAEVTVVGHGEDQVDVDELMSHQFVDRIFIGLGIPKVALGLPGGSNRSTSRTQRRLLLEQKIKPYQRQIRDFARKLYREVLDVEVEIDFDPVSARDAETVAKVSKILVEQGIKTPEEVEAEYWDWTDDEETGPPSGTEDPDQDDPGGETA